MEPRSVVIGIDGGGTMTRALCCRLDGQVLGYAQSGGSSVQHNQEENACRHVQTAIREALQQAGRSLLDVRALAAGLAGLDDPTDHEWAQRLTTLDDLKCVCLHVNDAVVAHAGALLSQPGIIVIAGTGAITYGVTEAGRSLRNYDFNHYANTAARALTLDCLHRLLAGGAQTADRAFVRAVLDFWQVGDEAELWERAVQWGAQEWKEKVHRWGEMAPLVTQYAEEGSPLPQRVCQEAAAQISISIRLISARFVTYPVSVALIGSAARSPYMQQAIADDLDRNAPHKHRLVNPTLSSAAGSVLLALQQLGIAPDPTILKHLRAHPQAAFSV